VAGRFEKEIITALVDVAIVTTSLDGNLLANEAGITIGLLQVVGTMTVAGTKTNEDDGTETILSEGTEVINTDGTELGTSVYYTTTNDGSEAMAII
jgi:hypothetical protein